MKMVLPALSLVFVIVANFGAYGVHGLKDFDWHIEPLATNVYSAFSRNQSSIDQFVDFRYRIPFQYTGKTCDFNLFHNDCSTPLSQELLTASTDFSVTEELLATVRIDMSNTPSSSIYEAIEDEYKGKIRFCARVDCGLNGFGSISFHETNMTMSFDLLSNFAMAADLEGEPDPNAIYKELQAYKMTLYPVEDIFDDQNLRLLFVASERWLDIDMNARLIASNINNPVSTLITAIAQRSVEVVLRRLMEVINLRRSMQEETVSGVEIDVSVDGVFTNYPAPQTEYVNSVMRDIVDDPDAGANFMGNLSLAIYEAGSFCTSPLANVTQAEFEYQKNLTLTYENNPDDIILVNSTEGSTETLNLTMEDIENYENYIDTCGNTTFPNITEPEFEKIEGSSVKRKFQIKLQETIEAYFCGESNELISPDPTFSQGDILQVCTTINHPQFHVEDTFVFVLAQPNTDATPFTVVSDAQNQVPGVATVTCGLGVCNHKMQVPSKFFDDPKSLQVSGVAILNFGSPDDRRRHLQQESVLPGHFTLKIELNTDDGEPQEKDSAAQDRGGNALLLALVIVFLVAALACLTTVIRWCRTRHSHSSDASKNSHGELPKTDTRFAPKQVSFERETSTRTDLDDSQTVHSKDSRTVSSRNSSSGTVSSKTSGSGSVSSKDSRTVCSNNSSSRTLSLKSSCKELYVD